MEFKSLKVIPKKNNDSPELVSSDEEYPYGTRIDLNDEHVALLGVDKCDVGDEVMVYAKAKITSKSQHERNKGTDTKHVELQITDMQVIKDSGDVKDRMYKSE